MAHYQPMNRILLKEQLTPFSGDYARWCIEQGALLREGPLEALDRENLAEEIEALGRSERREIENRLIVLLLHLLKWKYQPGKRKTGWKATILEARRQLLRTISESPSLKAYPAEIVPEQYEIARLKAVAETGMSDDVFPVDCPFSASELLDISFLPTD
jgi:hypothetical protein